MKTLNIKLIILCLFAAVFSISLSAQSPEQTVRDAEVSINQKIDQVHQLAVQRDIKNAFVKLDQINKEINKEFTWGTFDEKYREAKRSNPNFSFQIREDLPKQLSLGFWTDYVARCDKIMSDQEVITDGMASMVQLNRWDQAMAYSAQLKTMYETFTGAAENLGSANLLKFAYDLHGNMNDFIENYKKIEKAKLEGQEIENFQVDFNRMTSKARRSKSLYQKYIERIRKNQGMIVDFEYNIKHIHKLKKRASTGPLFPLSYADLKYIWNYEYVENRLIEECDSFENYVIDCPEFVKFYASIKQDARNEWKEIKGNIYASDDEAHKQEFLNHHTEMWAEFLRQVKPVYDNTYQIYCVDNSAPDTQNTDNPFDGATAGGSAQTGGQTETDQQETSNISSEKFKISNIQITENKMDWVDGVGGIRVKFDFFHDGYCSIFTNVFVNGKKSTNPLLRTGFTNSKTDPISINVLPTDILGDGNHKIKIEVDIEGHGTIFGNTIITVQGKTVTKAKSSSSNNTKPKEENQANNPKTGTTSQTESNSSANNNRQDGRTTPTIPPKTSRNSSTTIPSNAFLVGSISNSGKGQGSYKAIELKKLLTYNKIVFKLISGELDYIQLIWRKEGGIWETEYQGNKTEFDISKGLKNIPSSTTHLNFIVNSQHNRWSSSSKACTMEVYLIPRSGGASSNNFYDLIDQANVAFNINYWDEEQGTKSSSNPKQKSLDLLRKADRLINSEPNFNTQLEMVELLVSTSADFAERVHAYTAKTPFMELGAKRLHRAGTSIPAASKSASTYSKIASMWRTLTRAANWGDHAFNKMYCDEQAKKYAALAGE